MAPELISCLINRLHDNKVAYCHWKSNYSLAQVLGADTDLDLLIDRRCLPETLGILTDLGFKSAMVRSKISSPGIAHYYGLDRPTGQLVHVHLFTRLLTGESFVKSHLLPFESMLLEDVAKIDGIQLPSKSAELVVFVLRIFIKYGSLLDFAYLVRDDAQIRRELRWLQASDDLSPSLSLLRRYCPTVDEHLFVECVLALRNGRGILHKWLLGQRVRRQLKIYAIRSELAQDWLYLQWLLEQSGRRLRRGQKNKMLASGGALIAFTGSEATGKSTLVSECARWLGSAFSVRAIHVGKPPASWLTGPIGASLPILRRLMPQLRTSRLESCEDVSDADARTVQRPGLRSLIYAFRAVTLAWDRRCLLLKARRWAAEGYIVICDRYPSEEVGQMDSPRLLMDPERPGAIGAIYNWFARLEARIYQEIAPPDIALRLHVPLEMAVQRNRDRVKPGKETDAYLELRHRQSHQWKRAGTRQVYDIDTSGALENTRQSAMEVIWRSL